ncbi:MAG: endonuclease/exonuclease/phosphatase family protein [Gammaproteobacteria bacterium]|nr:endonuclease/exonuclease/phosphatase family protein [Gammaproteobacteria bacterium]
MHINTGFAAAGATPQPNVSAFTLSIASWNLQWLADGPRLQQSHYWQRCAAQGWTPLKLHPDLPGCDAYRHAQIHTAPAYEQKKLHPIQHALASLAADRVDILAVQEVQNPQALARVLPEGYQVACFTTRTDAQNLGYAVRNELLTQIRCREVVALSLEQQPGTQHLLRRGLELTLQHAGTTVNLLNVHLKSSCPKGPLTNSKNPACAVLQQQIPVLEQWIEEHARAKHPFMILGDWNRDLEAEQSHHYPARIDGSDPATPLVNPLRVRNLFPEINDHVPPASAMQLVKLEGSTPRRRQCPVYLDHMVVSETLLGLLDAAANTGRTEPLFARLVPVPSTASDHCILQMTLGVKP